MLFNNHGFNLRVLETIFEKVGSEKKYNSIKIDES